MKVQYPELLKTVSGDEVTTVEQWRERRAEILDLFQEHVYGRRPVERPEGLHFSVGYERQNYKGHRMIYRQMWIKFPGFAFRVNAFIPYSDKPVPAFVHNMHDFHMESTCIVEKMDDLNVPVLDIVGRGYALFVIYNSDIYPDLEAQANHDCGIFSILGPKPADRKGDDWASIAAWSWAMSRVMDYLETEPLIDSKRVCPTGHSRGGKTSLWAAAMDERFSMAYSNDSGCMGTAVLRGKQGEHLEYIARVTDWFCGNIQQYRENEDALPVDQHMLVAAMAPRPVYVASSSQDLWADPEHERLSCRWASDVYEKIYGMKGAVLPEESEIKLNQGYHEGNIGYHVKTGPHSIRAQDWHLCMDFRDAKNV